MDARSLGLLLLCQCVLLRSASLLLAMSAEDGELGGSSDLLLLMLCVLNTRQRGGGPRKPRALWSIRREAPGSPETCRGFYENLVMFRWHQAGLVRQDLEESRWEFMDCMSSCVFCDGLGVRCVVLVVCTVAYIVHVQGLWACCCLFSVLVTAVVVRVARAPSQLGDVLSRFPWCSVMVVHL